jgi:hypothetical protein
MHYNRLHRARKVNESGGDMDRKKFLFGASYAPVAKSTQVPMAEWDNYVENGGVVISELPLGMKNNDGWRYPRLPGELTDVFGCFANDGVFPAAGIQMHLKSSVIDGHTFRIDFKADTNASILAHWSDNRAPALVANTYGKGRTILFGTMAFGAYIQNDAQKFGDYIVSEIMAAGVASHYRIVPDTLPKQQELSVLRSDEGDDLLFVVNHLDRAVTVTMECSLEDIHVTELIEKDHKRISFEKTTAIQLASYGVRIFHIQRQI